MNEEEFKECSVVAYPHEIRFLHIKGGHIGYYVDRHVSDYVNKLQEENKQLKGSLQTYEILLKANVEENQQLKKQLQEKEDIINKAKEYCNHGIKEYITDDGFVEEVLRDIKKILDNKGE